MITVKTAYMHAILRALKGVKGTAVKTASGAIASFNSNTEAAITKGIFDIAYNSNGLSSMAITRCGKNLFPASKVAISTRNNMTFVNSVFVKQGIYTASISNVDNATSWRFCFRIYDLNGDIVTSAMTNGYVSSSSIVDTYDTNKTLMQGANSTLTNIQIEILKDCYIACGLSSGDVSNTTTFDYQLETGSTPSTYEAYSGDTYPVSFGTTIYGGYFDSVTGELYSTLDSDGTPLETPVKTELTPIPVTTLKGDNNIFCDTGDSDIEYIEKAASKKDRILSYLPMIYGRKELL